VRGPRRRAAAWSGAAVGIAAAVIVLATEPAPAAPGASTTTTSVRTTTTSGGVTTTTRHSTTTTASASTSAPVTTAHVATTAAPTTAAPTTAAVTPSSSPLVASSNAPFPAPVVGPIPPAGGSPGHLAELAMTDVYVAPSLDESAPQVVVQFKAPFSLPNASYKVSVVVGDPAGARVRASLVSANAKATPTGTVESWDGGAWHTAGSTDASFTGTSAVITVPFGTAPPGGSVWVEINEGAMATPTVTSPYFDRDALVGTATPGVQHAGTVARVTKADGTPRSEVAVVAGPPVVTLQQSTVSVSYDQAAPDQILGQRVTEATDDLRIAGSFENGAVVTDFVRINRTDGTLTLYDGNGAVPEDRSGDRSWVAPGTTGVAAGSGAATLQFDLDAIARALGITIGDDTTGIGLTRTFALADGRIVTADGVLATPRWFGLAAPPPTTAAPAPAGPETATVAVASPETSRGRVLVVAGVVLLALVALGVLIARRRRRTTVGVAALPPVGRAPTTSSVAAVPAVGAGDRVPWHRDDGDITARGTAEIQAVRLRATGSVPVVPGGSGAFPDGDRGPVPSQAPGDELESVRVLSPSAVGAVAVEPEPEPDPGPAPELAALEDDAAEPPEAEAAGSEVAVSAAAEAVVAQVDLEPVPAPARPDSGVAPAAAGGDAPGIGAPVAIADEGHERGRGASDAGGPEPAAEREAVPEEGAPDGGSPATEAGSDPASVLAALDLDLSAMRDRLDHLEASRAVPAGGPGDAGAGSGS
jgi:hypothetical protein